MIILLLVLVWVALSLVNLLTIKVSDVEFESQAQAYGWFFSCIVLAPLLSVVFLVAGIFMVTIWMSK